jgi:glycosyltransferase involved in cell wall biosynthesis
VAGEPAFRTRHANPYNALLYDAVAERGVDVREYRLGELTGRRRPDVVHLHWPELLFLSTHRSWQARLRLGAFERRIAHARRRGSRLVLTAHNDAPHENRGNERAREALERMLHRRLDGVFALSEAGERFARQSYPGVPVFRTPHGHYRDAYLFGQGRDEARRALGLGTDSMVLAAVGQVRPYKNLPALVAALRLVDDPDLRVVIAGAPAGGATDDVLRSGDPRLLLELERLDEHRIASWLAAADAAVLPYRRILNSGAALLALSAGRPVVVPSLGAMPELADRVGPEWVLLYQGEFDAAVLRRAIDWARMPRTGSPDLSAFDWGPIADATIDGYRRVLRAPARTGER